MNIINRIVLPIVVVLVLLYATATFQVAQYQSAIEFRLGEIVKTDLKPGLHFKMPFINTVKLFDKRILTLSTPPERFLTSEQKNLIVDYYIKWQIVDASQFYRSTGGNENNAMSRIDQIVKDSMKSQIASRTLTEVVSGDRDLFMRNVISTTNQAIKGLGIKIIDVRIMRIDLPKKVQQSVFSRMEKQRSTVAKAIRSAGEEQAKRITSDADRQRVVIMAEANRQSDEIRGEGDAEAAKIYANAYGSNPSFFAFYRSLNAYKKAFDKGSDTFVLSPTSPFFRYFRSADGGKDAQSGNVAGP